LTIVYVLGRDDFIHIAAQLAELLGVSTLTIAATLKTQDMRLLEWKYPQQPKLQEYNAC
jgi:hypothetical protein